MKRIGLIDAKVTVQAIDETRRFAEVEGDTRLLVGVCTALMQHYASAGCVSGLAAPQAVAAIRDA